MRALWQWLCGYIRISVCGRQVNRFLNLCSRNGIHFWRISYDVEQSIRASLRLRDFYDIKPYLRKTKTRLRIISKKGFPFWCHRHPRMKWFFVFLLCIICIGIYSLNFVWEIKINGNQQIPTQDILECLSENDVEVGQKRVDIDCSYIELQLREQFQNLGWVSVYFEHTKLCIDIKESLYGELDEIPEQDGRSYNMVANKAAVIYSIVTRAGDAQVKAGNEVKPGDVLVLGQCEIFNDNGEVADILYFPADALIYGDVVYDFVIPLSEMEIAALNLAELNSDAHLLRVGYEKTDYILEKLEENGVIILDKDVIIEKKEKNICFLVRIYAREQIGINIPAEEVRENEFERKDDSDTSEKHNEYIWGIRCAY